MGAGQSAEEETIAPEGMQPSPRSQQGAGSNDSKENLHNGNTDAAVVGRPLWGDNCETPRKELELTVEDKLNQGGSLNETTSCEDSVSTEEDDFVSELKTASAPPLLLGKRSLPGPASECSESSSGSTVSSSIRRALSGAVSWRPMTFRMTPRSSAGRNRHSDPKQVEETLKGFSLRVALNKPKQVKELLLYKGTNPNMPHPYDVNARDADGDRTPLHWAAARGYKRCITLLLAAGADKSLPDNLGRTAAELALECGQQLAHDLIVYGPALDDTKPMTGNEGVLSLHCALRQHRQIEEIMQAVAHRREAEWKLKGLKTNAEDFFSVNKRDSDGDRYPLHWAAARGSVKCIELLVRAGVNLGVTDALGNTAAALAMQFNQRAAHQAILQAISDQPQQSVRATKEHEAAALDAAFAAGMDTAKLAELSPASALPTGGEAANHLVQMV